MCRPLPRHPCQTTPHHRHTTATPRCAKTSQRGVPGSAKVCQALCAANIMSAAFSAIMAVGALVLPPIRRGMTEASTTRKR